MAIRLIDRYPNRANPATTQYPHGSGRNKSDPTADDGTPFDQDRFNDQEAFFQGLLTYAGITPSGTVDTVEQSDYLDAFNNLAGSRQVDSVSALRSGSFPASLGRIWLSGYYGVGTPGSGDLDRDSSDTSTADNGIDVFVDNDGVRWKRNVSSGWLAGWAGAAPSRSASENTTAINDLISHVISEYGSGTIIVPADVAYNDANLDSDNKNIALLLEDVPTWRVNDLDVGSYPDANGSRNHLHVRATDEGRVAQIWIMPRGIQKEGSTPGDQPAAVKVFHDEYAPTTPQNYRDGGLTAETVDSYNGMGIVMQNAKAAGEYIPFAPDAVMGLSGGSYMPLRCILVPITTAVAGNYFSGDYYAFDNGEPLWSEGMSVSQGQLVTHYGKIYEAQSGGTAGSTQPIHATYRRTILSVADSTGFQVGEFIKEQPTSTSGIAGEIDEIPDGSTIKVREESDKAIEEGWDTSATLEGLTSGATTALNSTSTEDLDLDDPDNDFEVYGTGVPVDGRTVSDGVIDWRFLDDIRGSVPGRKGVEDKILIGGDKDTAPIPNTDHRVQFPAKPILIRSGGAIDFYEPAGSAGEKYVRLHVDQGTGDFHIEFRRSGGYERFIEAAQTIKNFKCSRSSDVISKPDGATTLDVTEANVFNFSDSAATEFTGFSGGALGQEITVRFNTGNTTLVDSGSLELGGSNVTPAANTARKFVRATGSDWTMVQ